MTRREPRGGVAAIGSVLVGAAILAGCASGAARAAVPTGPAPTDPHRATGASTAIGDGIPAPPILAAIHVGNGPTNLMAVGDKLVVQLEREGRFQVIDPATNTPSRYLDTPASGRSTVVGDEIWTTDLATGTVFAINVAAGGTALTVQLPGAAAAADDAGGVWIASQTEPTAWLLDRESGEVLRTLTLPGDVVNGPWVLGAWLWVDAIGPNGEALFRLDPNDGSVQTTLPYAPATSLGYVRGVIWVTSPGLGYVVRVDGTTDRFVGATKLGSPSGLAADADETWVTDASIDSIGLIEPGVEGLTHRMQLGFPSLCCPLVAFGSVWVSSTDGNRVLRLDPDVLRKG